MIFLKTKSSGGYPVIDNSEKIHKSTALRLTSSRAVIFSLGFYLVTYMKIKLA